MVKSHSEKASTRVDWIILDSKITICWLFKVIFYGFYHSNSPYIFPTTLSKSKQLNMNSITWMRVFFKANPMWTIWEGGKNKELSFGTFWTFCWRKQYSLVECHANNLGEVCLVFGSCLLCLLHCVFMCFFDGTYVTMRYYCRWLSGNVSASNRDDIVFRTNICKYPPLKRCGMWQIDKLFNIPYHPCMVYGTFTYIYHEHQPNV